jgi:hypothetical protein
MMGRFGNFLIICVVLNCGKLLWAGGAQSPSPSHRIKKYIEPYGKEAFLPQTTSDTYTLGTNNCHHDANGLLCPANQIVQCSGDTYSTFGNHTVTLIPSEKKGSFCVADNRGVRCCGKKIGLGKKIKVAREGYPQQDCIKEICEYRNPTLYKKNIDVPRLLPRGLEATTIQNAILECTKLKGRDCLECCNNTENTLLDDIQYWLQNIRTTSPELSDRAIQKKDDSEQVRLLCRECRNNCRP